MKRFYLFFILYLFSSVLFAEMSFHSVIRDYQRTVQLQEEDELIPFNFYSYSSVVQFDKIDHGPWKNRQLIEKVLVLPKFSMNLFPPETWITWNSENDWGRNDGALWQGKGFNTIFSTGIELNLQSFSFRFYPEIWCAQNLHTDIIETSSSSGYGDYWTVFDHLQRYGDEPYFNFSWGQSAIRFNWEKMTFGLSTENIIIGPGQITNILIGENAGGFPHFDIGTTKNLEINYFGNIGFRTIWGFLKESDFFDLNSENDYAWISGTFFSWNPSFISNLSIGFNYLYYKPLSEWEREDIFRGIPFVDTSNSSIDNKDIMISFPFRWIFPAIGFEFYGEWARNDHFLNIEDLVKTPEHTQAFTLGINQIIKNWSYNILQLSIEVSSLSQERTYTVRPAGPWYRHGWSGWKQGYTFNGQLLGAAIGPGSDSQWIQLSWFRPNGKTAIFVQRVSHDKDYYYSVLSNDLNKDFYVEVSCGVEHLVFFNNFDLYGALISTFYYNHNFIDNNDVFNIHIELGIKYAFGRKNEYD